MAKKAKKASKKSKSKIKDVTQDYVFWVCDGRSLKNVNELICALDEINDDIFRYHVNESKNDFANWIKDVMQEEKLADKLFKTLDKETTKNILVEFVKRK